MLLGAILSACGPTETPGNEAATTSVEPSSVSATATMGTPQPATPAADLAEYTLAPFEAGERAVEDAEPRPTRSTTARVSFDAAGKDDADAYTALRAYFLREHAAVFADAVRLGTKTKALIAPQDEFESDAAYGARLDQWIRGVQAVFTARFAARNWEVFNLAIPPDAVSYNANTHAFELPYAPVLSILDLPGRDYLAQVADADARNAAHALPLLPDLALLSPLRSELGPIGQVRIAVSDLARARAIKLRFSAGEARFYLRFEPEVRFEVSDTYDAFIGTSHRQMRILKRMDAQVVLHLRDMVIYAVHPDDVLAVSRVHAAVPSDLWFLAPSAPSN